MARPFILLCILVLCIIGTQGESSRGSSNVNIERNRFGRRNLNAYLNTNRFESRGTNSGQGSNDIEYRDTAIDDPPGDVSLEETSLEEGETSPTTTTTVSPIDSLERSRHDRSDQEEILLSIANNYTDTQPPPSYSPHAGDMADFAESAATAIANKLMVMEEEMERSNGRNYNSNINTNTLRRKKHKLHHHKRPKNELQRTKEYDYSDVPGNLTVVILLRGTQEESRNVDEDTHHKSDIEIDNQGSDNNAIGIKIRPDAQRSGEAGRGGHPNYNSNTNVLRRGRGSHESVPNSILHAGHDYDRDDDFDVEYYNGDDDDYDDNGGDSSDVSRPAIPKGKSKNI